VTAAAREFADPDWGERWVEVGKALQGIEAGGSGWWPPEPPAIPRGRPASAGRPRSGCDGVVGAAAARPAGRPQPEGQDDDAPARKGRRVASTLLQEPRRQRHGHQARV